MTPSDAHALADRLLAAFPRLAGLSPAALDRLVAAGRLRREPTGTVLFSPGDPCEHLPFLLGGQVGVYRLHPDGKRILLYTVLAGESCIVSSGALLGHQPFDAEGVAHSAVELLALPYAVVDALVATEPAFRSFVFHMLGERLSDLMGQVEALAFHRLDRRVAALLLEQGPRLAVTHQQLAAELGVAREMVSRVLRSFSERGWLRQGREELEVLDIGALRGVAAG
jgi:CRP/FNR family transcriptional regulator